MKISGFRCFLVVSILWSSMVLRAQQADDSILIESEEALARSHSMQMETAEYERKNTEVELETKSALVVAKKNINQAKGDELKYSRLATKYDQSIAFQKVQNEKIKNEYRMAMQKVVAAEKRMKDLEAQKNTLSVSLEKQKTANEDLKKKLVSLNMRESELGKEIKKIRRQVELQKQRKQNFNNRIASTKNQVNKLLAKRTDTSRLIK